MRRGGSRLLAASAVLALQLTLMATTAHALPTFAGKRFDGPWGDGGPTTISVTADGTRLDSYDIPGGKGRCSDGTRFLSGLNSEGEGPATIDSTGAFAYRTKAEPDSRFNRHHRRVRGSFRAQISGRFTADGTAVHGTLSDTFTARHLRCRSSAVPFVAYVDGSPNAPLQDAAATTGSYAGTTSLGAPFQLDAFLPAHEVVSVRTRLDVTCKHVGKVTLPIEIDQLEIGAKHSFDDTTLDIRSVKHYIAIAGEEVSGRFVHTDHYGLTGKVRAYVELVRRHHRTIKCSGLAQVADVPFTG